MKCPVLIILVIIPAALTEAPFGARVYHGHDVHLSQFPFLVSIQKPPIGHVCGGSIISPIWILTAAHCIKRGSKYQIVAGITKLLEHDKGQSIAVKRVIYSPSWKPPQNGNDIALLQLQRPLEFNERVKAIQLGDSRTPTTGAATIAGWGVTYFWQQRAKHLQTADVQLMDQWKCHRHFKKTNKNTDSIICSKSVWDLFQSTISLGDSGGPLIKGDQLIGVVSLYKKHGIFTWFTPLKVSVFTRVSFYMDFIKEHVMDLI